MITRLLLALLFFLVAAPYAASQATFEERFADTFDQQRPLLRAHVTVTSDLVTLGDLIDHAGRHAEIPVFRAPQPGTRGAVPAYAVVQAARAAGLQNVDIAGIADVSVERSGLRLDARDLEQLVTAELQTRLAQQFGDDVGRYVLTVANPPSALVIGSEQAGRLSVDLLAAPSGRSEQFSAVIRTPNGREVARLEGRAEHRVQVPVLARPVARGDVIRQSDLRLQDMPYHRMEATPILVETADILGQAARRSLRAGAPISPDDVAEPLLIERQQLVTLVFRQGALALTVRARAMDDGAMGQSIDVMNLQSNRVVRGLVAGHGLVHVLAPIQDLAAVNALTAPIAQPAE